jgi:tRNA-splicing ligase RtcB
MIALRLCLFIIRAQRERSGTTTKLFREALRATGQPVLIGGTIGTASYILVGTADSERQSFSSSWHGASCQMSRHQAAKQWRGQQLVDELAGRGILIRSPSMLGVAEEGTASPQGRERRSQGCRQGRAFVSRRAARVSESYRRMTWM